MRRRVHRFYICLMRAQGVYVIGACAIGAVTLPSALAAGQYVLVPALTGLVACAASLALVMPRLTPGWLSHPSKAWHGIVNAVLWALLPLLFAVPTMGTVILMGLPEPLSQTIAVFAAGLNLLICGLAWWLALGLCLWPETPGPSSALPA